MGQSFLRSGKRDKRARRYLLFFSEGIPMLDVFVSRQRNEYVPFRRQSFMDLVYEFFYFLFFSVMNRLNRQYQIKNIRLYVHRIHVFACDISFIPQRFLGHLHCRRTGINSCYSESQVLQIHRIFSVPASDIQDILFFKFGLFHEFHKLRKQSALERRSRLASFLVVLVDVISDRHR